MPFKPSDEQQHIINVMKKGGNVMVDAVAGSGKTTTIISLAKQIPNKLILQVTYNSQLKTETRERILEEGLNNVVIHTYHSLATNYYDKKSYTDDKMSNMIKDNISGHSLYYCDIMVIDEAQDMTILYYTLLKKYIHDIGKPVKLLFLGDRNQGIYDFKEADTRYLTLANKLWSNYTPMVSCPLHTSYRLTDNMSWFINTAVLGNERIITNNPVDIPVTYIKCDIWKESARILFSIIMDYICNKKYKPEDIFILSPSIRNNGPYKELENRLVKSKINCYVPLNDNTLSDKLILSKKLVFSTFHQSKGLQRKVVIVYNFDKSYLDYYAKGSSEDCCPSPLYVAITRATRELILLEDSNTEPLPFLKTNIRTLACNYPNKIKCIPEHIKQPLDPYKAIHMRSNNQHKTGSINKTDVTSLIRFIKTNILTDISDKLENLCVIETTKINNIHIECKIKGPYTTEEVSHLNGLVIPFIYEDRTQKGETTIINHIKKHSKSNEYINKHLFENKYEKGTIPYYLFMTNIYKAITDKLLHKIRQLNGTYNWISVVTLDKCLHNLNIYLHDDIDNIIYEYRMLDLKTDGPYNYSSDKYGDIQISGIIDGLTTSTLWEFKCVKEITIEHKLQLLVYAWLWENSHKKYKGERDYKLLNIRTGEVWKLNKDFALIKEIVMLLFDSKYTKDLKSSDKLFIDNHKNI